MVTYYLMRLLVTLVAIPWHEAGHALASLLLGDPTARRQGRLSLNPLRHFDLLGTVCMVVLGVGWGCYAFVLLAAQDLPVRTLLKNAWYLMLLGGKATAAVLVTVAVSGGLVLLLFPISLILPALGLAAVTQFTVCWFVHIPLNDHVFRPYARTNHDHSEEP